MSKDRGMVFRQHPTTRCTRLVVHRDGSASIKWTCKRPYGRMTLPRWDTERVNEFRDPKGRLDRETLFNMLVSLALLQFMEWNAKENERLLRIQAETDAWNAKIGDKTHWVVGG